MTPYEKKYNDKKVRWKAGVDSDSRTDDKRQMRPRCREKRCRDREKQIETVTASIRLPSTRKSRGTKRQKSQSRNWCRSGSATQHISNKAISDDTETAVTTKVHTLSNIHTHRNAHHLSPAYRTRRSQRHRWRRQQGTPSRLQARPRSR